MNIIDCRYRPNTPEWMATFTRNPVYAEYVKLTDFDRKPTQSLAACAAQLGSLGIGKALVSGRDIESTYASPSSNDLVDACVAAFPDLFIGIYGYDPHKGIQAYKAMRQAFAEGRSLGHPSNRPWPTAPWTMPATIRCTPCAATMTCRSSSPRACRPTCPASC